MVEASETVEWIQAGNETAALMLEYNLIKAHSPRFNIRLKDDKSYPFLMLSCRDEWPRAAIVRERRRKDNEYFGPYVHAYAIRKTLDQLLRTFPVRTCQDSLFTRQHAQGKPCLLFHIEKCCGPCIDAVTKSDYQKHVEGLARFLRGDSEEIVGRLENEMWKSAESLDYEAAGRIRDRLAEIRHVLEQQEVVSHQRDDLDVIGVYGDELEYSIQILKVRRGRLIGRWGAIADRVEDLSDGEFIERVLGEIYGDERPPSLILVPAVPSESEALTTWLSELRGSKVVLRVPERGGKTKLIRTAQLNAQGAFETHRLKRRDDPNARAKALRSLQMELGLEEAPLRIEAYDISTLQGTDTVSSMVVLEDALPMRRQYRHFRIRTVQGQDDFAAMEETIRRRFKAYLDETVGGKKGEKFRYPPGLVVIDGGIGQLGRAVKVLDELGLNIPVIGLAKRMEEVFLPGKSDPLILPRDSEALYLLQQIRDEAHRFAISYHRTLRSKRMVDSVLDDIEGVGASRKAALIKRFGSLKKIREASEEELTEVVPRNVAESIYSSLHGI